MFVVVLIVAIAWCVLWNKSLLTLRRSTAVRLALDDTRVDATDCLGCRLDAGGTLELRTYNKQSGEH